MDEKTSISIYTEFGCIIVLTQAQQWLYQCSQCYHRMNALSNPESFVSTL